MTPYQENENLKAPTLQEYKKGGNETVASVQQYKVGDIIKFGSYVQDYGWKDPIEWQVLDIHDGKALVISKYGIDYKPYDTRYTDVTWETCTLRKWLNDIFMHFAFSKSERARILSVRVPADKNPKYSTNPGNATQDQIFLLSISEAQKYFGDSPARKCKPTAFAKSNGAWSSSEGNCCWWLRSPGRSQNNAAYVNDDGDLFEFGNLVYRAYFPVRPALWIDLNT